MKYKIVNCPICKTKLKIKSASEIKFDIPLSKAQNEVWCNKCQRWIKFDIEKGEVNGKYKEN
jgi:uncharacterized protein YbaR (Trm112 family)